MATVTAPAGASSATRQWQVPVFFIGLAAIAVVAVGRPYLVQFGPNNDKQLLDVARADLSANPPQLNRAIENAQKIVDRTEAAPRLRGEAHFVVGSVLLKKAENEPAEGGQLFIQAKHHLEQSDRLGVPDTDRSALTVRLAKAWLATNADPELVIRALNKVAETSDDPFAVFGLLAESLRRQKPPSLEAILEATRQQVARANENVDAAKLAVARMNLADLLLQTKNSREAKVVLTQLVENAPAELKYPARRLLANCAEESQDWPAAAKAWEQLRDDPKLPAIEKPRVLLALGKAYAQMNRPDEAALAWQMAASGGGPEAQTAGLRLAEFRCATDPKGTLAALADALGLIASPDGYRNDLVPLDELRTIFDRCGEQMRSRGDFESAVELAKLYGKVAVPGKALTQQAEATSAWADALIKSGQPATNQLIDATRMYMAAASAAPTPNDAATSMWHAANLAQRTPDHALALDALNRYVQMESVIGPERVAAELYTIGGVHERAKNINEARTAYQRCAASPNTARFKARYALARLDLADARQDEELRQNSKLDEAEKLQLELRARLKFDDAEKMLQDNLGELRQAAQPDATVQELTVYGLADIAFERGDYPVAEPRLQGALQEYPNSPNAVRGRNQLALCIWRKAVEEYRSLSNEKIADDQRQRLQKQLIDNLNQAAEQFARVEKSLLERPADSLTSTDRECLTKASFSIADVMCVQGRYQEALDRYEELVRRHAGSVYELHAIRQVWHCQFYYFKDDARALGQLTRLRDAMEKLPDAVLDGRSDIHQRNYWVEKIVDMGKVMNKG